MILYLLAYVVLSLVALGILEVMYIAVMGLQRAHDEQKLKPWAIKAGTVFMYFGLLWDVLCNVLIATVVFLEFPREATISQRLRRLVQSPQGWRKSLAIWFAESLLNPFSNGGPHVHILNADS
jgi:hypothetical protein